MKWLWCGLCRAVSAEAREPQKYDWLLEGKEDMQRHLCCWLLPLHTHRKSQKNLLSFFYFFLSKTSSALQHMLGILNGNAQIHAKHFLVISEGWFEEPSVDGFLRTSSVSDILPWLLFKINGASIIMAIISQWSYPDSALTSQCKPLDSNFTCR